MMLGSHSRDYVVGLNCSDTAPAEIVKKRQMKEQIKAHTEKWSTPSSEGAPHCRIKTDVMAL